MNAAEQLGPIVGTAAACRPWISLWIAERAVIQFPLLSLTPGGETAQ